MVFHRGNLTGRPVRKNEPDGIARAPSRRGACIKAQVFRPNRPLATSLFLMFDGQKGGSLK
jgi:hypothetical protein